MSQSELINKYQGLKKRSEAVGITLYADDSNFSFSDVPGSNGIIFIKTIEELEFFIRGYELGYKSSL